MAPVELKAEPRTLIGKAVKKLRREGIVPAVVYGPGIQGTQAISVPARDLERAYTQFGKSALLRLKLQGGSTQSVFIHQVQYDHTHRHLTHVDFLAPNMRIELTVAVPVVLTGESPATKLEDGVLVQSANELQITALPDHIPGVLAVDVSGLAEIHAQILAGDVELPAGVTLASPAEEVVVTVSQVQLVEVEEPVEEGEEGEEGEGEEGAEEGSEEAASEDESSENE